MAWVPGVPALLLASVGVVISASAVAAQDAPLDEAPPSPLGVEASALPESSAEPETVVVSLTEMSLDPAVVTLAAGTYTFEARNDGFIEHGLWIIADDFQAGTPDVAYPAGESQSFTVDLEPGEYVLFCPVRWHRSAGMAGTLVVTE